MRLSGVHLNLQCVLVFNPVAAYTAANEIASDAKKGFQRSNKAFSISSCCSGVIVSGVSPFSLR